MIWQILTFLRSIRSSIRELQAEKTEDFHILFQKKKPAVFWILLDQVELGSAVDEKEALTSGAVSYYTLYFTDGEMLTISPGRYFQVGDTYYEFRNYDELWDRFIEYNSIQG